MNRQNLDYLDKLAVIAPGSCVSGQSVSVHLLGVLTKLGFHHGWQRMKCMQGAHVRTWGLTGAVPGFFSCRYYFFAHKHVVKPSSAGF